MGGGPSRCCQENEQDALIRWEVLDPVRMEVARASDLEADHIDPWMAPPVIMAREAKVADVGHGGMIMLRNDQFPSGAFGTEYVNDPEEQQPRSAVGDSEAVSSNDKRPLRQRGSGRVRKAQILSV